MILQTILWHVIFSTLCGAALALVCQGLNGWIAAASLTAGTGLAYVCRSFLHEDDTGQHPSRDWVDAAVMIFILAIGLRQFGYLYFSVDQAVQTLHKNNYGDLPLHVAYIRHMVDGVTFPPDNPFFSLEKLRYPFGMDFYNALWEQLNVPTQTHLFIAGMVLLAATVAALYRFGGILVVGAFFLNGGWAGWQLWITGHLQDYQEALTWKNFFLSLFITQRGLLMALPLGFWLVRQVRERFFAPAAGTAPWSRGRTVLVGVAWGILPLFHMHAFIVVSVLIAFYTLAGPTPKSNLRQWVPALVWAVPMATAWVLYLTDLFRKGAVLHWQWSWLTPKHLAFFFIWELGPWAPLILAAAGYSLWKGNLRERAEWLMAGGAFLVFNVLMLAPWEWDKLKVLIWFYLLLVAMAGRALVPYLTLWRKAVLCLVLFFSGTVSLLAASSGWAQPTRLYEWRELWNTKGAAMQLPKDAVVAACPTFNHPLSFWGYAIAVGYTGHLWSHGVDYQVPEKWLTQLYQGDADWARIAARLRVTHIFWGPVERARFGEAPPPWRAVLPNLSPVPGYELYAVGAYVP